MFIRSEFTVGLCISYIVIGTREPGDLNLSVLVCFKGVTMILGSCIWRDMSRNLDEFRRELILDLKFLFVRVISREGDYRAGFLSK